jgi:hypothetical protein
MRFNEDIDLLNCTYGAFIPMNTHKASFIIKNGGIPKEQKQIIPYQIKSKEAYASCQLLHRT